LIICYSPCINHGIKGGLTIAQSHEKEAVNVGYWHQYRFNPALKEEGKNPFVLDSKEPKGDFAAFLKSEVRYSALYKKYSAEVVDEIFARAAADARERYASYQRLASFN